MQCGVHWCYLVMEPIQWFTRSHWRCFHWASICAVIAPAAAMMVIYFFSKTKTIVWQQLQHNTARPK